MIQKRFLIVACISLLLLGSIGLTLAQDDDCSLSAGDYREQGIAQYQADDIQGAIASFTCVTELVPDDTMAFNNLGFFYALSGNVEAALENYATAQELDPDYPLTYINRGDLYANMGQFEDAVADFAKGFELSPEDFTPYTFLGWGTSLYYLGDYEGAVRRFNNALEGNPDYVEALGSRGFSLNSLGEYELALSDFRKAVSLAPDYAAGYLGLADAAYAFGLAQIALDSYNTYLSYIPTPPERVPTRIAELERFLTQPEAECSGDGSLDTYLTVGNQALQNGNAEVALNQYSCAVQSFPDEAMPYNNRGFLHLQTGNFNLALSDLTTAVNLDPELALAYSNRGQALYSLGDYSGALIDLQKSIQLDNSTSNMAYATSGYVYTEMGEYEQAIPYLVTAANSITGNLDALSNLGYAFYQLDRYDESLQAFQQLAVAMNRDNFPPNIEELVVEVEELTGGTVTSAAMACGTVTTGGTSSIARNFKVEGNQLLADGDFEAAIEQYECALELNPFDSYAYNNIGLTYYQMGEYDLAMENYNKSLELNPWDAQTLGNRGYLLTDLGNYEQALADFNLALRTNPEYANGWFGRAALLAEVGRYEEAKADLDALMTLINGEPPQEVQNLIDEVDSNLSD